jgi:hypothetical protein
MSEQDDEASAWAAQQAVATAAVNFANDFLGLRKGASNVTLTDADVGRWLDIVRAVSWVESRHGTGTGAQPARDPMQCGNPNDVWWKELTGQTTNTDRFVRGGTLSNLDADELPGEADTTAGFEPKASLGTLGTDANKGHDAASFVVEHSYYWAVPILIHKTNTKAGAKTYQCGDLARDRLVTGAYWYNGQGDEGYEDKINAALDLFGGLPILIA